MRKPKEEEVRRHPVLSKHHGERLRERERKIWNEINEIKAKIRELLLNSMTLEGYASCSFEGTCLLVS